jgi:hypothetical protein
MLICGSQSAIPCNCSQLASQLLQQFNVGVVMPASKSLVTSFTPTKGSSPDCSCVNLKHPDNLSNLLQTADLQPTCNSIVTMRTSNVSQEEHRLQSSYLTRPLQHILLMATRHIMHTSYQCCYQTVRLHMPSKVIITNAAMMQS